MRRPELDPFSDSPQEPVERLGSVRIKTKLVEMGSETGELSSDLAVSRFGNATD